MFRGCTHFKRLSVGKIAIFTLGQCETCGKDVQEANTMTVFVHPGEAGSLAQEYGLEEWFLPLPPEIEIDEETGECCCENCPPKAAVPVQPALAAPKAASGRNLEAALALMHQAERLLEEDADLSFTQPEPAKPHQAVVEALRSLELVLAMHEQSVRAAAHNSEPHGFNVLLDQLAEEQIRKAAAGLKDLGVSL
jgi:hypothetical protein